MENHPHDEFMLKAIEEAKRSASFGQYTIGQHRRAMEKSCPLHIPQLTKQMMQLLMEKLMLFELHVKIPVVAICLGVGCTQHLNHAPCAHPRQFGRG